MRVAYLPVLPILRDLYLQPRDMQRFQRYIATLTGGSDDVVLPIGVARAVIETLGKDPPYATVFAALYGDAAAEQLGYPVLGLPSRPGFEVALADALEVRRDPLAAL